MVFTGISKNAFENDDVPETVPKEVIVSLQLLRDTMHDMLEGDTSNVVVCTACARLS